MPAIVRYLITTADERSWKFDRPVIFLGEWCRTFDRKHIWQDMDAIVAPPYGLGQLNKDADNAEARVIEERLFLILCDSLNQFHGTQNDSRFWRMVLGHWLRRYVDAILNRIKTLEQCLQTYKISGTTAIVGYNYTLATMDSYEAIWAFSDKRWNNQLYVSLLGQLSGNNFPIEVVEGDESEGFNLPIVISELPLQQKIFAWGYRQVKKLACLMARNGDAFIINSYLPKKEEIKLQLAMGQVPQLWASPKYILTKKADYALRQKLGGQLIGKSSDIHFEIMCALLFELLPACYLEGFAELVDKVHNLPWPKNPKFIFTSNNFDTDEMFKLWAAEKVQSGAQYITGQHGNNYGTHRYFAHPSIEEVTADKFLTWGWSDGMQQHVPAFILNLARRNKSYYQPNGDLLLIETSPSHMLCTWDTNAEFMVYFEDQLTFAEKLENRIKKRLIVRLHHEHVNSIWKEQLRWARFDADVKLDTGSLRIRQLISQSRLIVHSYDSTGILETLSQNIPTLAFWQNGFDHLRDSAKPYYQLLVNAGILHLTAESVAMQVNEVWCDVDSWWQRKEVQDARNLFCERFAKISENPIKDLKTIFYENI
ncbi:MAG: hypothetical protein B7Y56_12555 [Gallionellales bacterium 35-53-114]|jgi:putative transferase (TIGR04331 family)|nr:MAG: hypothetical protein B7Y56_12555 [Gallionellales bacterium 35-53-114]OYZ63434.1 MAG: hypothetical protein B7Y04_08765 [Gallionellales bacterium 24-53-125]OZB10953.1 MAG: hypothetical protein B7X61_00925 [Gallionellales bacterium 39-52-133]HQS58863.1 LIC12162 family protein [Gallionellaceae bacterium]HQS75752.1 LIC12162 family protein [Gallionellaceae bacterium]